MPCRAYDERRPRKPLQRAETGRRHHGAASGAHPHRTRASGKAAAGENNRMLIAAAAEAGTGHNIEAFPICEAQCDQVPGHDISPFDAPPVDAPLFDPVPASKPREEVEQPTATVYNDLARPFRGVGPHIAASPAPPDIAVQRYNCGTMPTTQAKPQRGRTVDQVTALGAGRVARIHPLIRVGRRRAQDLAGFDR
jgi:hypothetical protein